MKTSIPESTHHPRLFEFRLPDPADKPTLTVEETGEIMCISRSSAYAAARSGQIPTIKIGRRVLVPTAQLRRMLGMDGVA